MPGFFIGADAQVDLLLQIRLILQSELSNRCSTE